MLTKLVGLGRKAQKQDSNVPNELLLLEGREGVKWELEFAFFWGSEMGFCALRLRFMKQKL